LQRQADLTIGVVEVPLKDAHRLGVLSIGESAQVAAFCEKPAHPTSTLASMGICVFNRDVLEERLSEDARRRSSHDFGKDIIPSMIGRDRVFAFRFRGYWRDVGTVESYWQANMDLLDDEPEFDLYDPDAALRTKSAERPPVRIGPRAQISQALVSNSCVINGKVHHSVLSPGVVVEAGAMVEDSVIFDDAVVGEYAVVQRCIVDKEVRIGAGAHLGWGDDHILNRDELDHLNLGITLVGKRARVPAGVRVSRNCRIDPGVCDVDFGSVLVPGGETVAVGSTATGPIRGRSAVPLPLPLQPSL
jgi:glucose-1-phosphate adenylyltransferase